MAKTMAVSDRILYVRLPCNPIFPIGVVYLSDHIHKVAPDVEQCIFDMGTVPPLDFFSALDTSIDEFKPNLLVFSWRDIQIYAPVGGRGGNPLQNAFEFYYSLNPFIKLRGALNGLRLFTSYYSELWRNSALIKKGLERAKKSKMSVTEAEIEASVGNLALLRGKLDQALKHLEFSRQKYENLKMPHQTAIAELEIADVYLELNLLEEAFAIYRKVTEQLRHLKMQSEEARARANFGRVAVLRNDLPTARKQLKKAAQLLTIRRR